MVLIILLIKNYSLSLTNIASYITQVLYVLRRRNKLLSKKHCFLVSNKQLSIHSALLTRKLLSFSTYYDRVNVSSGTNAQMHVYSILFDLSTWTRGLHHKYFSVIPCLCYWKQVVEPSAVIYTIEFTESHDIYGNW